jgi:hypothetical protein
LYLVHIVQKKRPSIFCHDNIYLIVLIQYRSYKDLFFSVYFSFHQINDHFKKNIKLIIFLYLLDNCFWLSMGMVIRNGFFLYKLRSEQGRLYVLGKRKVWIITNDSVIPIELLVTMRDIWNIREMPRNSCIYICVYTFLHYFHSKFIFNSKVSRHGVSPFGCLSFRIMIRLIYTNK